MKRMYNLFARSNTACCFHKCTGAGNMVVTEMYGLCPSKQHTDQTAEAEL